MCDPDPSRLPSPTNRGPVALCVYLPAHGNLELFLVPFAVTSLSHLTSVICAPDPVKAARSCTMWSIVNSVSICCTWSSEAVSGSISRHCSESSNTRDLCTGCMFGSEILHTEAPCQLCVRLLAHLCKCLFLVPLIVIA